MEKYGVAKTSPEHPENKGHEKVAEAVEKKIEEVKNGGKETKK